MQTLKEYLTSLPKNQEDEYDELLGDLEDVVISLTLLDEFKYNECYIVDNAPKHKYDISSLPKNSLAISVKVETYVSDLWTLWTISDYNRSEVLCKNVSLKHIIYTLNIMRFATERCVIINEDKPDKGMEKLDMLYDKLEAAANIHPPYRKLIGQIQYDIESLLNCDGLESDYHYE
jgi:hypothetical protein